MFCNASRQVSNLSLTHSQVPETSVSLFLFDHISLPASSLPGKWKSQRPWFLELLAFSMPQSRVKRWRPSPQSEDHVWKPRAPLPQSTLLLDTPGHWYPGPGGHPSAQAVVRCGHRSILFIPSLGDASHQEAASCVSPVS